MAMIRFAYPAEIEIDEEGYHIVSFPDLPGARTAGADRAEALVEAEDCVTSYLEHHMAEKREIPNPSRPARGQAVIAPDPVVALKAALHQAMAREGLKPAGLARRLGIDNRQATRLLDPRHSSSAERLTAALKAMGRQVAITVSAANGRSDESRVARSVKPRELTAYGPPRGKTSKGRRKAVV